MKDNEKSSKPKKRICVGTQTFKYLRENNFHYVDKTKEIHKLIHNEKVAFLSRPRRFGKSLLVSTLESLFSGEKELFKGLHIYNHHNWNKKYPVINLDLSKPFNEDNKEFIKSLNFHMDLIAEDFSIELKGKYPNDKLTELILRIHKMYGAVVVLVDEYDAPILNNINDKKLANANRRTLQSFYMGLKNSDKYIDFIFITGISKFIHTSIFSKLNNPSDITLLSDYSTICGITHDELIKNYQEYLHVFADKSNMTYDGLIEEFNRWYDGYSFDGEKKVFNPFSTLSALKNSKLSQYWFSTGTPHFLVDILKYRQVNIDFENMILSESDLNETDPLKIEDVPLLFQGGYLTINKTFINENSETQYSLRIPNFEVQQAYENNLTKLYMEKVENKFRISKELIWDDLVSMNCDKLSKRLRAYITGLPYYNRLSKNNAEKWKFYSMIFTIWAKDVMGFEVNEEKAIEDGRIDYVLENPNEEQTIIVEMKYSEDQSKSFNSLINEAFKQISDKKYWWAYTGEVKLMALALKDIEIDNGYITDVRCKIKNIGEIN